MFVYWAFQNVSIPTDLNWLECEMFPLFCFSPPIHASFQGRSRVSLKSRGQLRLFKIVQTYTKRYSSLNIARK